MPVNIDFDPAKNARNIAERGLSFAAAAQFDFSTAVVAEDTRRVYPERRYRASGLLGARLHMLVFAPVAGGIRVISFRKANRREVRDHEKETQP